MADLDPWDRQPGETSKAYQAFVTYRDLGHERTQLSVEKALGKSKALISRWAASHDWVRRAAAWDSIPGKAVAEAYQEMAQRIAAQHEDLSTALMAKLRKNVDLLQDGKDPTVSFSTALSAARQSHQFATELTKPESGVKKEISDQIAALLAKLSE